MRSFIVLVVVAVISAVSCAGETECGSTLLGTDGFKVCLFDRTNNVFTDTISTVGNTGWYAQNELKLGKCYCNPACSPSQIVCEDPAAFTAFAGSLFGPGMSAYNLLSQIVYRTEQWNFYCYCGSQSSNPCPTVTNPQKCYLPYNSTSTA